MAKHEIEIPDLPEGWCAVAYRIPVNGREYTLSDDDDPFLCMAIDYPCLIVEKIKPRSIKLEETEEDTDPLLYQPIKIDGLCVLMVMHNKIWRVVEEE